MYKKNIQNFRVLCWGTCDFTKPRNRILHNSLKNKRVELIIINKGIWNDEIDKSQIKSIKRIAILCWRIISAYPGLILSYLKAPQHDVVFIGYLGNLDVLILWPFTIFRRVPIVWDVFISLYDTIVKDRKIIKKYNPIAILIYIGEWLACRAAEMIIMDTKAHSKMIQKLYHLEESKCGTVYLGVEPEIFPKHSPSSSRVNTTTNILFYGQFIPLHGISVIIEAAELLSSMDIKWKLIGKGQEEVNIKNKINKSKFQLNIEWEPWVPYEQLQSEIVHADICLGIFGSSIKAANVIPNKVWQILSVGKPLITRDSPAIRELIPPLSTGIKLINPITPEELANAIIELTEEEFPTPSTHLLERMSYKDIGDDFVKLLQRVY